MTTRQKRMSEANNSATGQPILSKINSQISELERRAAKMESEQREELTRRYCDK